MPACSDLFQPEESQKEPPASCTPWARRAVRWCSAAWTSCWSVSPLGCMYRLTPLLAGLQEAGREFVHALFCHVYGYKKKSRQPLVR